MKKIFVIRNKSTRTRVYIFKRWVFSFMLLMISHVLFAADFTVDGICYAKLTDVTQVEVTWGGSYTGSIIIPSIVTNNGNTYTVTSVGTSAFYNCSGLTSVSIPSSVTSIGDNAFYSCSGLTSVNIPSSVTSIGDYAFYGCKKMTSVNISMSVISIGRSAFYNCSGLTSVSIPSSVTSIADNAFFGCSGLTSVSIPLSVTSIGNSAFNRCSGLTSVNIPSSVTSIGDNAFYSCSGLTTVIIPSSVSSMGTSAFKSCSGLTSVSILSSLTSIAGSLFESCSGLTSVDIPSTVTSIGDNAFYGCSGLTSAIIPSSVTSIGSSAFYGCSGITSVNISSSINSIGMSAFTNTGWYNSQANGIVIKDNWLLSYKGTMPSSTVINIASGIKNIADGAFYNCSNLVSVSIPSSVTSIGNDAFNGCIRLTSIYTYSYNPITLSSDYPPFKGVTNCTLHVPNGSKSLYQAATGWKNFTAIVEFDASAVISPVQESVQLNYHSATRVLYVDGAQTSAQVDVYTLKGERLLQATISAGTSMSLTTLQKGIYIVKATINQTVLTGKIEI